MLKSLYTEYMNVYSGLPPRANGAKLAAEHALLQESNLYTKNNKVGLVLLIALFLK
jgi:hypothetical protein